MGPQNSEAERSLIDYNMYEVLHVDDVTITELEVETNHGTKQDIVKRPKSRQISSKEGKHWKEPRSITIMEDVSQQH